MKIKKYAEEYGYYILLAVIAIFSFVIFRGVGGIISGTLTMDDLCSVQFSMMGDGFLDKMKGIIANDPTNVPIFYLMLYGWIELFGYSANVMRILPEIAAALFVIVVGLIGKTLAGKRAGVIASVVASSSIQLIYAGYQVRAYAWLMLFAAIAFYFWIKRNTTWKSIIAFSVAMLLMSYTHFLGALVCAAFGSLDVFRIIFKKENKKCLYSYVIYVVCFVPYLMIAYLSAMALWETFWPPVPGIGDFFQFLGRICPMGTIGIWLVGIVFCIYLMMIVTMLRTKKCDGHLEKTIFACYWVIFAVLGVAFVYSRFIKPTSSIWVYRYFLVLYPFTVTIVAYAIEKILVWIEKNIRIPRVVFVGILLFVACRYTYSNTLYAKANPDKVIVNGINFEELTADILSREDVFRDDTLVYFGYPTIYFDGWKLYASEGGNKELPNLYCDEENFTNQDLSEYNTLYVIRIATELPEDAAKHVDTTYELDNTVGDGVYFIDRYVKK